MNTHNGWIKLYRCLLEDAVCQKSAYFHLWVTLLLMAAHKDREFIFNNQIQKLQPGQLITGRKKLSKLTGIHPSTVQRGLRFLENAQMIDQQTNTKFSIITIKNWDYFQSTQTGDQPVNNERTSTEQPANTYKNDKNEKNLSLREEVSSNDFNKNDRYANDPIWQDTERKLKEYENEQKRIQTMLQRTNP